MIAHPPCLEDPNIPVEDKAAATNAQTVREGAQQAQYIQSLMVAWRKNLMRPDYDQTNCHDDIHIMMKDFRLHLQDEKCHHRPKLKNWT